MAETGNPMAETNAISDKVHDLLEPVVTTVGVDLVDVEWNGNTLRVVVDQEGGINTSDLAKVNRLVSPILDEHDPVPSRYTLEVSSPGVERKLNRPEQYQRAVGEDVVLKMHPGIDPRRVKGKLMAASDGEVTVEVREIDGNNLSKAEQHSFDYDDITKGRTVFEWGPGPKPGKGPSGSNNNARKPHPKANQSKAGQHPKAKQKANNNRKKASDANRSQQNQATEKESS